jgi:nucleoside phosphorylase
MSIQSIPNICTGLQEQIGRGKELFLCIEEYGLFGAWADSTSATNPSSKESLNQLIVDGAFEPRSRNINAVMVGSSQTKFSTREKRALAVKLGFCLMDFFDADFNSKKIYFLDSANQAEKREIPYLAFRSQLPASSESYNFKMGHPHPALLSFAKLLIEMDCGQMIKLDIDRDYTRNRDAWLKLLDIVDEIQGDVGESYLQAIRGCLLAHQKIAEALGSRERGRKDADSKVRKKIYKEIVQKLEQGLSEATPRSDLKRRRSKSPPPAESEDHRQLLSSWTGSRRRSKRAFSKASISKRERTDEMHGSPFSGVSTLAMRGVTESFAHGIKIQASDQMIVPRDTCRPTRRKDFEIAVVCALPIEFNAVSLLVDQFWDEEGDVYGRAVGDENTYTTGRIGKFNVVLALLPNMGKISAAGSAASLRASFPRLRLVMLTGICGGVPRPGTDEELLLGDVVISKTVLQYDHGRLYPDRFAMKDTLEDAVGRPTKNIRNLVSLLETDLIRERIEQRAAFFLEELQGNSRGGRRRRANYEYPGADNDNLFEASFRHKHYSTEGECVCTACFKASDPVCDETSKMTCSHLGCHTDRIVSRQRIKEKRQLESDGRTKEAQAPLIFVGRVGSGDMVIKSGEVCDKIAKEHDILAFEMEGAGVLDEIPCIVAKGVCDYADSHKNKSWQAFAAATAASVTKALLERYTQTDNPHEAASNAVQSSFVPRDRY